MGMKQFHWNHLDQRGKIHKVGLLHGARTGHVLIHVNGKITSIDFKVLESKQYSLFIDEELIELNIIRHDDHFEYTMEINEEVKTPLNAARKKERKKMSMQSLMFVAALVVAIVIATVLLFRSDWYNAKDDVAMAELEKKGLFTKARIFTFGNNKFTYNYVVNQEVFRIHSGNNNYAVQDGDEYMVKYLPNNPRISEIHFVKPTEKQIVKVKQRSVADCLSDSDNAMDCHCLVDVLYEVGGYLGMMHYLNRDASESQNLQFNTKGYQKLVNSDLYIAQLSAKCN
jgi:tRNA A-37 threonylcarbamoyl transferase component Bud32